MKLLRISSALEPLHNYSYFLHRKGIIIINSIKIWREMESVCALCHVDLRNYKVSWEKLQKSYKKLLF